MATRDLGFKKLISMNCKDREIEFVKNSVLNRGLKFTRTGLATQEYHLSFLSWVCKTPKLCPNLPIRKCHCIAETRGFPARARLNVA